jgi:hypothetical protein
MIQLSLLDAKEDCPRFYNIQYNVLSNQVVFYICTSKPSVDVVLTLQSSRPWTGLGLGNTC